MKTLAYITISLLMSVSAKAGVCGPSLQRLSLTFSVGFVMDELAQMVIAFENISESDPANEVYRQQLNIKLNEVKNLVSAMTGIREDDDQRELEKKVLELLDPHLSYLRNHANAVMSENHVSETSSRAEEAETIRAHEYKVALKKERKLRRQQTAARKKVDEQVDGFEEIRKDLDKMQAQQNEFDKTDDDDAVVNVGYKYWGRSQLAHNIRNFTTDLLRQQSNVSEAEQVFLRLKESSRLAGQLRRSLAPPKKLGAP